MKAIKLFRLRSTLQKDHREIPGGDTEEALYRNLCDAEYHLSVGPFLEVFPFVLIIALYFGLFLIVSEVGGIPEPTTMLLLGSGLIALAGYGKRKFLRK